MSPNYNDVKQFVRQNVERIIIEKGSDATICDEDSFIELGVIDSLDFMKLVALLETHYATQLDLSERDPLEFLSIAGLAREVAPMNGS